MSKKRLVKVPKNIQTFVQNTLRRASSKWYAKNKALSEARVPNGTFSTGRIKYAWKCATCGELCKKKDVQVDHIDPVVPLDGYANGMDYDLNEFAVRLFCSVKNLQVLCKPCHKLKSADEAAIRSVERKIDKSK